MSFAKIVSLSDLCIDFDELNVLSFLHPMLLFLIQPDLTRGLFLVFRIGILAHYTSDMILSALRLNALYESKN